MARIKLKIHAMSFHTVGIAGINTHIVSVRVGLGAEEGKEVRLDVAREDLLCSLLVEIDNKGQRLASDEGSNSSLGDVLGQHSAAIVKGLQQKHSLALDLVLSSNLGTGSDGEGNVINAGSSSEVSLRCVRYLVVKHSTTYLPGKWERLITGDDVSTTLAQS